MCWQIVSPHDIVNPNIDELSVMTYVSYYRDAKPKEGMPTFAPAKVEAEPEVGIGDEVDAPAVELPTFKAFSDEIASVEQAREYAEVLQSYSSVVCQRKCVRVDGLCAVEYMGMVYCRLALCPSLVCWLPGTASAPVQDVHFCFLLNREVVERFML